MNVQIQARLDGWYGSPCLFVREKHTWTKVHCRGEKKIFFVE